jgi:hypothetical protein
MNAFRLIGDMTHLASFVVLLLKILATRSCRGEEEIRAAHGFPIDRVCAATLFSNRPPPCTEWAGARNWVPVGREFPARSRVGGTLCMAP